MKMVMKMLLLLLVTIAMMPCMPCSYACHANERNSLLDLKEGLNFTSSHNTLQSWKGFNYYAWEGVTCHPITAHIISLDLSPQSLNASSDPNDWPFMSWRELREGLFQLQHLEHLDLSESAFFPPLAIPSHFHKLQKLSGSILISLGELSNLTYLNLSGNYLSGTIPTSLGKLSKLANLDLSSNSLSGTISTSLSKLTKLKYLSLRSNSLSGYIPKSLGKLLKLTFLYMGSNFLSDTITTSLGKLSKLTYLHLSVNSLSGTIPTS